MKNDLWSEREALFRQELKLMRQEAGFNQLELAKRLGKPQSFVSKYESGERQLKFLELESICIFCGTTISSFSSEFSQRHPRQLA